MSKINPKTIKQGNVLLVDFPYNDKIGSKRRPAVVSRVKGDQVFIVKITSQIKEHPNNILIENGAAAGLVKPSQVQCNREICINKYAKNILVQIGNLDQHDLKRLMDKLTELRLEKYVNRLENSNNAIKQYCEKRYDKESATEHEYDKQNERGR